MLSGAAARGAATQQQQHHRHQHQHHQQHLVARSSCRVGGGRRTLAPPPAAGQFTVEVAPPKGAGSTKFGTESGDNLRLALIDEKQELYGLWGKAMNCSGNGQCGTCIVEVTNGMERLNGRTPAEEKKLKGKPATYRLACQTKVGDGKNSGKVALRLQPK